MTAHELNRNSLSEQIYGLLKDAILRGDFTPGQRLSPQELCDEFQVSATPIRDALRRLEVDGLVQVNPRRGTFVAKFTAQDVREVFESRRIIEQAAAEKLPQDSETIIQRMATLLDEMATLIDRGVVRDYPRYLDLDKEFHYCIVQSLHNSRMTEQFHNLRILTYVALALAPAAERRTLQTHAEHRAILGAFQKRDVDSAKQAIALHLENAATDILRKMSTAHPEATIKP